LIQIIRDEIVRSHFVFAYEKEGTEMTSYRVCFFNEIPRNDRLFRCCQRTIVVYSARGPEQAIEAAKKRFARLEGIPDWKIHAAGVEVEVINPGAPRHTADSTNPAESGPDTPRRDGKAVTPLHARPPRRHRVRG
jgi:hypothetical protein